MRHSAPEAERLAENMRNRVLTPSSPFPNNLYHYTNAEGLSGILRSKSIWATAFDFLNDRSEFTYARELIRKRLNERSDQISEEMLKGWADCHYSPAMPHFVASLCESGDLLGQWRGYTQSQDGYAVAFPFRRLAERPIFDAGYMLANLVYSRVEQLRILDSMLDEGVGLYLNTSPDGQLAVKKYVFLTLISLSYKFKDESFSGEREWRLIGNESARRPEQFRIVRGHFVPYIELPLESDDIDHIIQGPGPYRQSNKEAICRFADSRGFIGIRVEESQIPLA